MHSQLVRDAGVDLLQQHHGRVPVLIVCQQRDSKHRQEHGERARVEQARVRDALQDHVSQHGHGDGQADGDGCYQG